MRARVVIALGVAVCAVTAVVLVASLGGGTKVRGVPGDEGPLRWVNAPLTTGLADLPNDHIVSGQLHNVSLRPIRVTAFRDIKVVDAAGRPLVTSAVFERTYGHGLFDPTSVPAQRLPEAELRRTGNVGYLEPGKAFPLTVAWREAPGGPTAARIAYPGGSLALRG